LKRGGQSPKPENGLGFTAVGYLAYNGRMRKAASFFFYFFFFAAFSALLPYLVLYYNQLGLPGFQIGLLTSLGPLISLVGSPMLTGLADSFHRHRLILTLAGLATAVTVQFFRLAGGLLPAVIFFGLLALVLVNALVSSPVTSLADSAVMHMYKGDGGKYGRARLGGTIGWMLMAPLAGAMIEKGGLRWGFWLYGGLMILAVLSAQFLEYPLASQKEGSFLKGLRSLLVDRLWLLFLAMMFVCGVGIASINTYLLLLMQSLGAGQTLMGVALSLATVSEAPALYFSNRLTGRFSPRSLLLIGMGVLSLRLLLTGFANTPGWVLVAQSIQGLTFPILWVAGVSFAHRNAPPGLHATAQGVMGTAFMGLGTAAGSFVGGLLLEPFGVSGIFLTYGALLLVGLVFFGTLTQIRKVEF
jgi:PPP family 3-phenylpropionic acid transporter